MSPRSSDDRAEIDRRFAAIMASLDDAVEPQRPESPSRPERPSRPEPAQHPENGGDRNRRPEDLGRLDRASQRSSPVRQPPFSLDAAMASAEPDDDPLELPMLPPAPLRPGLVIGFSLLGLALLLAVVSMVGLQLGHDLGVAGAGLGVIGLVVLLLNTRRGPRDDSHDYDPRHGSQL